MIAGIPIIISAPSGAGKTSLVKSLLETVPNLLVSVSHTTRKIRPGEIHGENYYFISEAEFQKLIAEEAFLEYAKVFDNHYGTSKILIDEQLKTGANVIFEIDWQGAEQIRKKMPAAISIFILPPSMQVLETRLERRAQDNAEVIEKRMLAAKNEIAHYAEFDYLVVNDIFDIALKDLQSIIYAERLRLSRQKGKFSELIQTLLA